MPEQPSLIWVDLETTGLSAKNDVPLEAGIIITDRWGVEIASNSWLIYEEGDQDFLTAVDEGHANLLVHEMHTKNGLWDDLDTKPSLTRMEADDAMYDWLDEHLPIEFQSSLPMAGSSIGSLDRPFFLEHFPSAANMFHYRNVDISSVKEICSRVNPPLYVRIRDSLVAESAHRVLEDARASIAEYRAYCDNFFFI